MYTVGGYAITIRDDKPVLVRSHRGLAIMKEALGADFQVRYAQIKAGGNAFTVNQYIDLIWKHPLDFAATWSTRAFLLISLDAGRASASALLAGYTSAFFCLLLLVRRCRTLGDVLRPGLLLLAALLLTVAAPIILFVEMRNALTVHAMLLAIGVQMLTCTKVQSARSASDSFRQAGLLGRPMPLVWIAYGLFVATCFTLYGVTLELTGSEPGVILFTP